MEKSGNKQKYTWILLIGALAVYFFMRFFFAITLPFLLAFWCPGFYLFSYILYAPMVPK